MDSDRDLPRSVDTVVIGAGQAGLAMSHELTAAGSEHIVLEARDRLGGGWLNRWDSFCLVTPNWSARLPGFAYSGPDPDGFMPRGDLVAYVAGYARSFAAPVVMDTRAIGLAPRGAGLRVTTTRGTVEARNVVVASGAFQAPKIPAVATELPAEIVQLHTEHYRNEAALPPGAVLVVGSGQSGCQVAEELHEAGRRVFFSVGSCWNAPRRYRGKDVFWWVAQTAMRAAEFGLHAETVDDLPSPWARYACNPQLTGKNGGHDINLRRLGAAGVTLLGRLAGAADGRIELGSDLSANLANADSFFDEHLKPEIDVFITAAGVDAPADEREPFQFEPPILPSLDLQTEGISTVIWASGYRFDLGWIPSLAMDETGYPVHRRGVTEIPGLYLLGLPWLYTRTSSLLSGVGRDAAYLAERITA